MLERLRKRRAAKQEGDVHALDQRVRVQNETRVQSETYRSADPRDSVRGGVEAGVVMGGPGGVPQEGKSVEERRRESADWRERRGAGSP